MTEQTILELKHITKLYPGVVALNDVSFGIQQGEIHAIMGENGAGKSTLIKIIGGAIQPTDGTVVINRKEFSALTPSEAMENGVGVIYQEFNLVPSLSVAENICLGNKLGHKLIRDKQQMRRVSAEILTELGLDIDPNTMVGALSTGQQQMVEIAKQMIKNVKILIMDEPTASLSLSETNKLLDMTQRLREKGVTILYISHRLEEVFRISDRISVFMDGRYIGTKRTNEMTRSELIKMMVGRDIGDEFPKHTPIRSGEVVLSVRGLCGQGDKDISFDLHRGEILGISGLVGAGRTEMAKMIYGFLKKEAGTIHINGREIQITKPSKAISAGLGLIPEDRKREGVFLNFSIDWNVPIMSIKKLSNGIFIDRKKMLQTSHEYIEKLSIATPSGSQMVRNLSGGNQQKVALAKTLATDVDILILDEPTRGIDVGAKQEIYHLMYRLIEQGKSIIMISSELEEVIGVSDRMLVFYEGQITGMLEKENYSQEAIMAMASGIREDI